MSFAARIGGFGGKVRVGDRLPCQPLLTGTDQLIVVRIVPGASGCALVIDRWGEGGIGGGWIGRWSVVRRRSGGGSGGFRHGGDGVSDDEVENYRSSRAIDNIKTSPARRCFSFSSPK